ncbi:UNVERIFIED_CONTAM: hypothetical protein O8I53_08605 [Campylobacter lari]
MFKNEENKENKIILLSKLFTGSYLKNELGGECINFVKFDNNKRYLFIPPHGRVDIEKINKISYIVFINYEGNNKYNILGFTKNFKYIYDRKKDLHEQYLDYLKKIKI